MKFHGRTTYRPARRAPVRQLKPIKKQEWDDDDLLDLIGPGDQEPRAGESNLP